MRQAVRFPVRLQSGRDLIAALCVAKCQSRHNCSQPHRNNLRGYSITSSARASSVGGTVRPSALAPGAAAMSFERTKDPLAEGVRHY